MFEKLTQYIAEGNYTEALFEYQEEFFHISERTPLEVARLCILEASLWEGLNDSTAEFDAITRGLSNSPDNYELFYMLGLYYNNININKAYLCMEMAFFYCDDEEDQKVIEDELLRMKESPSLQVRNVSVMILSYNDLEIMKDCVASVEQTMPKGTYEIVVVDNASTQEGTLSYLREKEKTADYPFMLIENSENLGFPKGCNIGASACDPENDILFLNNDAVLTMNALFMLRMGLYDNKKVGATGPLSNSASLQEVGVREILPDYQGPRDQLWHRYLGYPKALEAFRDYARPRCVPSRTPLVRRFRLTGFAVLVSRGALLSVIEDGQVFDERFSPAYFEDDDLGIRIARAGFEQYLCSNSFVYHNGGSGFGEGNDAMEKSREIFKEKWGFDVWGYSLPWFEAADKAIDLALKKRGSVRIIDLSCGMGATAGYIKSLCPEAFVAGVCSTSFEAGIAALMADEVIWGDVNTVRLPWKSHTFDIVLADKTVTSRGRIGECLKEDGVFVDDSQEENLDDLSKVQ